MKSNLAISVIVLAATLIAGCSKEPPKCSDPKTIELMRIITGDQLGIRSVLTVKELEDSIKVELPRATGFDEKIKMYTCTAKVTVAAKSEMAVSYSSQLDDRNQHIVSVEKFSDRDILQLRSPFVQLMFLKNSPSAFTQYGADGVAALTANARAEAGLAAETALSLPVAKAPTPTPAQTAVLTPEQAQIQEALGRERAAVSRNIEQLAPQAPSSDIAGTWIGRKGNSGVMRIQAAGPKFNVALNVSEPSADCKGSIEGQTTLAKDTLTMLKMNNGEICNLSISFDGFEASIFEDNCPAFKAMQCSFVGSLTRQK